MKCLFDKTGALACAVIVVFSSTPLLAMPPITLSDTNSDGVISADEIRAAHEAQEVLDLALFDSDGDGRLSGEERRMMHEVMQEEMVETHDVDGNGELSRAEHEAAREAMRSSLDAQLDVNNDGVVSEEERAGMNEVMMQRPEQGPPAPGRDAPCSEEGHPCEPPPHFKNHAPYR